jgi:hypothetical protein
MNQMPDTAQTQLSQYVAQAARRGLDNNLDSTIEDSLVIVNIDPELKAEYEALFFDVSRKLFVTEMSNVGDVMFSLNVVFLFLRRVMSRGFLVNTEEDQARIQEFLTTEFGGAMASVSTYREDTKSPVVANVVGYVNSMVQGNKHSLRKSERYEGGIDIVMRASQQDNMLIGTGISYGDFLDNKKDSTWERNYYSSYAAPIAQKAMEAAKAVYAYLFKGAANVASQSMSINLPLSFDFSKVQTIVEETMGFKFPEQVVHNVEHVTSARISKAKLDVGDYLSLDLCVTPLPNADKDLERRITQQGALVDPEALSDMIPKIRQEQNDEYCDEGKLLNRTFGSALTISLPQDLARYISQSPDTLPINYNTLDNWFQIWSSQFIRKGRYATGGSLTGGRLGLKMIPRYCLPITSVNSLSEKRKSIGMAVEDTRGNEEGLFIETSGKLSYQPKASEIEVLNQRAAEYETLSREIGEFCGERGISPQMLDMPYIKLARFGISYDDYKVYSQKVKDLASFENTVLGYNWDTGIQVSASSRPGIARSRVQYGAVRPDSLTIADYLGFDLERNGKSSKSFADSMMLMTSHDPIGDKVSSAEIFGNSVDVMRTAQSDPFKGMFRLYSWYVIQGKFDLLAMIKGASDDLGIAQMENPAKKLIFADYVIPDTGGPAPEHLSMLNTQQGIIDFLSAVMSRALAACSGGYGSFVYTDSIAEGIEIEDHPLFFTLDKSPANHFRRIYSLLGGYIVLKVMQAIQSLSLEELSDRGRREEVEYQTGKPWAIKSLAMRPTSREIFETILPTCIMYGKYAPDYERIEAEAEEALDSIGKDDSLDVSDIHFAGSRDNFSVFPHQLDAHRYLRKPKPPKFAILDIQPGGGKTSIGLGDMASIVKDMEDIAKIKPLVICPDGLIGNWCDDMRDFTDGAWNMIPINSEIFDRWGAERLRETIEGAPPNTIVVVGIDFIKGRSIPVTVGNSVIRISTNMEFIRSLNFNYVIIDESHKLKKHTSARHKVIKQLTTSPSVEYLRIATGTLIADRVKDIEGQVALYSPHIFRQGELSNSTESEKDISLGDSKVPVWKVDSPQKARRKLSKYAAVITKKKKEWAFMLPSPIEHFYSVGFFDDQSGQESEEDVRNGQLHEQLYNTVVESTVKELEDLIRKNRSTRRDDDDGDDDADNGDDTMEMTDDDELASIPADKLDPYLARIERLIINPEKDPLFEDVFVKQGVKQYKSRKARYIVNLIKQHFDVANWSPDTEYSEYNLVRFEGDLYLSKKLKGTKGRFNPLPPEAKGQRPDNSEFWRKEPSGKLIVFCRYTNSVNAVYDALPANLQAKAVKFTGEENNKWANLESFKNDPSYTILIANEQGMSEGHNLQIASRMIRVEGPWGPGELDQSASRIFRPDPKGALGGNIYRETIFLDWVLANNTLEVAKLGRLISKVFAKTRFDEADNPNFDEVLRLSLPEVSMSLETLRTRPSLSEYAEYTSAYAELNNIIFKEFQEMRDTMPAEMIPVPPTEKVKGSRTIQTPFIRLQSLPQHDDLGPVNLATLHRNTETQRYVEVPMELVGKPVITDQGFGVVVNVNTGRDGDITSVLIRHHGETVDDEPTRMKPDVVFLATKVTPERFKNEFDAPLAYTQAQIRKHQKELEEAEEKERKSKRRAFRREAEKRGESVDVSNKRKKNVKEGKPINTDVKPTPKLKPSNDIVGDDTAPLTVNLTPAYYHQYLTLEADRLEDSKIFKKMGFKVINEYAYLMVNRRNQINAVFDYIEDNFDLSNSTIDRLSEVFAAFEKGKRGLYNLELASNTTLPHFFAVGKRIVKNRKEVRFYPLFMHDQLMVIADIATSPAIRKHINKAVPGANTKWQLSPGGLMYFAENKADLNRKVREIRNAGYTINNPDLLKEEIRNIRFRRRTN